MPRSKTGAKRKKLSKDDVEGAMKCILQKKMSIGEASRRFAVKKPTLIYHLQKFKSSGKACFQYIPEKPKKIFTVEEELLLVTYLKDASNMHYGLSLQQVKKLAYQFAMKNNQKVDPSWNERKIAGDQWLRDFRRKYENQLSLRKPEATNLAKSVATVFNNFKKLMDQHNFDASRIWNCDELSITAAESAKSAARKKRIGNLTQDTKVTLIASVSATGNSVPPMFIFPLVNFKQCLLTGAPSGSIGAAHPSGWSNEDLFLEYLQHFITHVKPSVETPVLLLIDNHDSHVSIPVIDCARNAGIVLMVLHPHISHKMHPLDLTVFDPFKTYYNSALNNYMQSSGDMGKPFTIYEIAALVGFAYPLAFTLRNITSGFKKAGLVPCNENVFTEEELGTDRPKETRNDSSNDQPSTSKTMIRPHPKASNRGRQRGQSCIRTETPEKLEARKRKMEATGSKTNKKVKGIKKSSSESDCERECLLQFDESHDIMSELKGIDGGILFENDDIVIGNFILVKLANKKTVKHYIAEVENKEEHVFKIKYLKRQNNKDYNFTREDNTIYDIELADIILKLPPPSFAGGSARKLNQLSFGVDLSDYNVE